MRAYLDRLLGIISFSSCLVSHVALGQISPDGTLPTQVDANSLEIKITGGTQVGKNLFHSFNEFSLPMGSTAYFNNSMTIDNIISRVTGGKVSLIDGLIKANGAANLFMINPMGFVFGPNARLDLGGSFIASSASSIKFADGREFGVNHPESSLLTVAVPVGLQFGQTPPGSIINRSQSPPPNENNDPPTPSGLQIKSDKTLAFIGGNVTLDNGNLTAWAGKIELGSVAENSYVSLTPIEKGWQFGYQGVQNFLDVLLTQNSIIDASDNGGTVQIQGRRITLNQRTQIALIPISDTRTGDLIINGTESVEVIGLKTNIQQGGNTTIFLVSKTVDGGKVVINTQKFSLTDGALIDVETAGAGKGGDILINASESAEIIGTGRGESTLLLTATSGMGQGGNIVINTKSLIVRDGGQISADTVISEGQGGTISINAQNTVEISGIGITPAQMRERPSLISASSGDRLLNESGFGEGGSIDITTDRLIVRDRAQITVESFQKAEDFALKSGAAGIITVNANSIFLDNQSQINAVAQNNNGSGGEINLTALDSLELRNNSSITAQANFQGSSGNGGNIQINTPFIIAVPRENSDIVADAGQGNGGNINITASGLFGLQVQQGERIDLSEINASSETGISGIITISRPDVDSQSNLTTLPTKVINTDNLIVQSCRTGVETAGEFSLKGRGGLPVDPNQTITLNQGLADLGNPLIQETHSSGSVRLEAEKPFTEPIIEAQGWLTNEQGQIILTAQAITVTPRAYNNPTKCSGP